jgi:hypothetical protein
MNRLRPEDFLVSPEDMLAMAKLPANKSSPPRKPKREMHYWFPKRVLAAIVRTNYMPTLPIAMAVYQAWYRDFKHRNPVKLTSALLTEFRISKKQKIKGLKFLEQSGQFLVERFPGHNPRVMMNWILPKD